MKLTNTRLILFLAAFLISVVLVYLFDGRVVPVWGDPFAEEYEYGCGH